MSGPVVLGVERVNNPHVLPTFAALARRDDIDFTGCVIEPLPEWRAELGWSELPEHSEMLQPWRSERDRRTYETLTRSAEIVVWPGLKFDGSVRKLLARRMRRRISVIWAERFIARRERSRREALLLKLAVRLANGSNVHLMEMGCGALDDFRAYGATRWRGWQFGYAVEPVELADSETLCPTGGPLRLLFVGALRRKKALDVLLRALAASELPRDSWLLRVVGDGNQRQDWQELARTSRIADRVEFVGTVGHERMPEVYRAADVLILPSSYEGWGAVVNEAMEHGLATVVSDGAGCASTLVEHGVSGFVFKSGDEDALAGHLRTLAGDRDLCQAMRHAARNRIKNFRPDAAAERAAALFRGLSGHDAMPEYEGGWCARSN